MADEMFKQTIEMILDFINKRKLAREKAVAEDGMVVGDQNADRRFFIVHRRLRAFSAGR